MPERSVRSILHHRRFGPDIVSARPDETVSDAAKRMAENNCGSILVVENGRLLGLFASRDLLVRVVAGGLDPTRTHLRDVMTTDPEAIGAEEPASEAIRRMDKGHFRHLLVVDGEHVLGVLSTRDIPALALGGMAEELHETRRLAGEGDS